jgi:hypothetical protein
MNEMRGVLPRLNDDDPEPGELDDYATRVRQPDPTTLAQAKGEAAVPTAPPPPTVEESALTCESSQRLKARPPIPREEPDE